MLIVEISNAYWYLVPYSFLSSKKSQKYNAKSPGGAEAESRFTLPQQTNSGGSGLHLPLGPPSCFKIFNIQKNRVSIAEKHLYYSSSNNDIKLTKHLWGQRKK